MDLMNVLLKPILTEKSSIAQENTPSKYYFLANLKATKTQIKLAFKAIYGVAAEKVNVITRKPAKIRTGTAHPGFTRFRKIAIITLPSGVKISVTGEKEEASEESKNSKSADKKEE